ncbi:unnamed protein product, partial [Iphiclides podalirius]
MFKNRVAVIVRDVGEALSRREVKVRRWALYGENTQAMVGDNFQAVLAFSYSHDSLGAKASHAKGALGARCKMEAEAVSSVELHGGGLQRAQRVSRFMGRALGSVAWRSRADGGL